MNETSIVRESLHIREVEKADLPSLLALEHQCFTTDRLSRRSFRHWITTEGRVFLVAEWEGKVAGYLLIFLLRGTRLARLYSVAIDPQMRGKGIAKLLLLSGEEATKVLGCHYLRLEVSQQNPVAISLYESMGYLQFGIYHDYYGDHSDALRMQKRIRHIRLETTKQNMPWIRQTTPFTCGPASLMMAMSALSDTYVASQHDELQIWREATTIFMTSGHGGCHPMGLALAAKARGFEVEVWVNREGPLFIDGVRNENKKRVMEMVHQDFEEQMQLCRIPIHYTDITQTELIAAAESGGVPIILISTYRLDGKKAPHWVVLSGYDDTCLYVHDPDTDEKTQQIALDCQFMPLSRNDFDKMSCFGSNRLRTAVVVRAQASQTIN
ncbi:MAG: GNAT family N-acetyltransferase/peptidase C39 family protein [Hahellaceae bacterium]|nr:GNAT family N-acetyltransferase/peptidase C39 family protein [Hahellaceae bacterium]MCP5170559.1 GNAT family N-acetyltransferase/peptidase C39 family protein [Hahellaceae bacterium]